MAGVARFAPSATGHAHPGTLLAALLNWLDARSRGDRLVLRLEDVDPERATRALGEALVAELAWFGLTYDAVSFQSDAGAAHRAALARLDAAGLLYDCACSRSDLRQQPAAADGGRVHPAVCVRPAHGPGPWPRRFRLRDGVVAPSSDLGDDLDQNPRTAMGDPVLLRRDGAIAYHLAVVVDDAAAGITRVVRGRDLAASTAVQLRLHEALGLPAPRYRHHLLLNEAGRDGKLSKFHQAIAVPALRLRYDAPSLCGFLAHCAGLVDSTRPISPQELLSHFDWQRVRNHDVTLAVEDGRLRMLSDHDR
jgi:glutamyl/glutaminyl-tRNA synthetase